MNQREATLLLEKYNNGSATAEEIKLLENWYSSESLQRESADPVADLDRLKDEIWRGTLQRANLTASDPQLSRQKIFFTPWLRSLTAALVVLCLGIGYFFLKQSRDQLSANMELANRIEAGKQQAVLTLANGRRIVLTDSVMGKLAEESGVSIVKTADGKLIYHIIAGSDQNPQTEMINTISTARGEHYQVILPDGSRIWLNAGTSLKFPASFTGNPERRVELNGEAYFEVAKDKLHPFKVKTNGPEIEVLGTHFNICSYGHRKSTKTTLLEGSVKVSSLGYTGGKEGQALSEYSVLLRPGEQAVQEAGRIIVTPADTEQAIAWKEGWFYFKSTSLKNVLEEASEWYDLEIVYEHDVPNDHFTGKISRNASLGKFMKLLKLSDVKFRIEGRRMIINKY